MAAEASYPIAADRSAIQDLTLLVGLAFLAAGIGGFIPGITTHYGDLSFAGHHSGAKLLGVFQISVLHNLVHVLFGIGGIVLSRTRATARSFLLAAGAIYVVLFLYGLFTAQNSGANFVPLDHADDILHLVLGLGMLALGTIPDRPREGSTETLAGFLAAAAIFVASIGVAYRPLRLIPLAIVLALIATAVGGRAARLSAWAVFIAGACFVIGLAAAVITSHPLW